MVDDDGESVEYTMELAYTPKNKKDGDNPTDIDTVADDTDEEFFGSDS
jgi:hypothetical protein